MTVMKPGNMSQENYAKFMCDNCFLVNNIVEAIHDAVLIVDADGIIMYANPAYSRIVGVNVSRIVGKSLFDLAPDSLTLSVLQTGRAILEKPVQVAELNIETVASSSPIYRDNTLIGVISIFKEVSTVRRINEELNRIKEFTTLSEEDQTKSVSLTVENGMVTSKSKNYQQTLIKAMKAASTDVTVLILGETGVGKEMLARAIHNASKRKNGPFLSVNCAAIPENLLESELFGFESGAFTGARKGGKPGKFELAQGGTLFLDEIGELDISVQSKLLRALEEKTIERLGGTKSIRTDIRIIAATNQDIEQKILEKSFREDLFYRLNVYGIYIPSLRERKDDIPLFINHFLKMFSEREKRPFKMPKHLIDQMNTFHWPGNIRELRNIIEYAIVSCEDEVITVDDLPEYLTNLFSEAEAPYVPPEETVYDMDTIVAKVEKQTMIRALNVCGNNKSKAIKMLGISRSTFYEKMARYGLLAES